MVLNLDETATRDKAAGYDERTTSEYQATFFQSVFNGAWMSDGLPFLSTLADDLCFVKICKTDLFNHAPAQKKREKKVSGTVY